MGIDWVRGLDLRALQISFPSIPGSIRSKMTRLGRFFLAISNPEGPSEAVRAEKPDCFR